MADSRRAGAKRSLNFALTKIRDEIPFVAYKVTSQFCSTVSFSRVSFDLAAHVDPVMDGRVAIHFDTLFNVDVESPSPETVEFISTSRKHPWPPFFSPYGSTYKPSEREVMLGIACEILAPFCKEVLMERRAQGSLSSYLSRRQNPPSNVNCANLGMGSISTWHGTPDLRVRSEGVEFVCQDVEEGEDNVAAADSDDESSSQSSDGQTTNFEGKITFNSVNLQQAIATGVVSSFTERNCHPGKLPIVPTILIDQNFFRVILYDCEKDILLMSPSKNLSTKGTLSQSAMALLWVVLNHR